MDLVGVGVRYGRREPWVLRAVSARLAPGCAVEVTGGNGAGKSSLLRVLAGVLPAAEGRVTGRPGVVGWAPERFPTAQPFTAGAYLEHAARVRGLAGATASAAVGREAGRLHLGALLDTGLAQLSKGSAQKVGIAQALLVRPELLVLDEPWSGLDAEARAAVPAAVAEVLTAGGRVVVCDHQRRAESLPLSARWHVEGGTLRELPAAPAVARPEEALVQVPVPREQLAGLLHDLRQRGLAPRVVADPSPTATGGAAR